MYSAAYDNVKLLDYFYRILEIIVIQFEKKHNELGLL